MKKNYFLTLSVFVSSILLGQNALTIPDTISGSNINLELQLGTHSFWPGISTNTMGVNGDILGPTIILNKNEQVTLNVDNKLGEPTTIHWHGLHVAPEHDGGPHTVIDSGSVWSPSFTVLDHAGTYWYHPHLHHKTNEHTSKGIAGLIIVRDQEEAVLNLPRTYGVDDFPVVIQTKEFNTNHQITWDTNSDSVLMVNATRDPVLSAPAQVVRLRVLNGSSNRSFNLGLSNNESFSMIASDGGLLESPLVMTRLLLSPGERAEILLNLTGRENEVVYLRSYAAEFQNGIYGATNPGMSPMMTLNGYNPNWMNGTNFDIMQINVTAPSTNPVTSIPSSLVTVNRLTLGDIDTTRAFTFNHMVMGQNQLNGHFSIDMQPFDMDVINHTIPLNNIEMWTLTNQTAIAHPFHVHMDQFFVLDRNGVPPPAHENGRKDVVLVRPQETVRIIMPFVDFYNDSVPYMYHCHMLTHEDHDMMGQFVVVNKELSTYSHFEVDNSIRFFPNPNSDGTFYISHPSQEINDITVISASGQQLSVEINRTSTQSKVFIKNHKPGVYIVKLTTGKGVVTERLIIN